MITITSKQKVKMEYTGISINSMNGEVSLYRGNTVILSFIADNYRYGDTIHLKDITGTFDMDIVSK